MATVTFDKALAGHRETATSKPKSGFFANLFNRLIAAREAEARRRVSMHLAHVPGTRLAELGLSAREIEVLRHGVNPDSFLAD